MGGSSPPRTPAPPPGPTAEELRKKEQMAEAAQREKDAKKRNRGRYALISTSRRGLLDEGVGGIAGQKIKLGE